MLVRCVGAGVVYSNRLVVEIGKDIETFCDKYPAFAALIDRTRVPDGLAFLKQARKAIVERKAYSLLGVSQRDVLPYTGDETSDGERFEPGFHLFGQVIDAAVRAAQGMSSPAPLEQIDGWIWADPRRFTVVLPKELIVIDESEMRETVSTFIARCTRVKGPAEFLEGITKSRRESKSLERELHDAVKSILNGRVSENVLAAGAGEDASISGKAAAGHIKAATIEIFTENHAPRGAAEGSARREREDEVATSILRAIRLRVEARVESLHWRGRPECSVALART